MDAKPKLRTADVYGMQKDLPLNYVIRPTADEILVDNLTRKKHLVIHGSSKQGKSSLRKHSLSDADYVQVHCSNKWDIGDLNSAILKQAGYETSLSQNRSTSSKPKVIAKYKIEAGLPGVGTLSREITRETTSDDKNSRVIELDIDDVNDIIRALEDIQFKKFIVLEDFHYLKVETQKDFSIALKAYHEESDIYFIIVGVWLEEGRLVVYNGDLTGRIMSIDADKWTIDELRSVIDLGGRKLNVRFADDFKKALLENCFESVYIVQEVCYQACLQNGLFMEQDTLMQIGGGMSVPDLIKDVVEQQTARYNSFLQQFAFGFQSTGLEMYKWILYAVLKSPIKKLEHGLRLRDITQIVRSRHPLGETLNAGSVTQALQATAALQVRKELTPIILDYDQTNLNLRVVDRSFLIWLDNQDIAELLADLALPIE